MISNFFKGVVCVCDWKGENWKQGLQKIKLINKNICIIKLKYIKHEIFHSYYKIISKFKTRFLSFYHEKSRETREFELFEPFSFRVDGE